MCGRFTLTWDQWRRVAETLGIDGESEVATTYRPRFNLAPTDEHFIVTSEFECRKARPARWGLVNRWARDNRRAAQCINAKAGDAGASAELQRSVSEAPLRCSCRRVLRVSAT